MDNKRLYQGIPSTTEAQLFKVGTGNTYTKVHKLEAVLANVTSADAKVSMSLVPNGNVSGVSNRIIPAVTVPANGIVKITLNQAMEAGDFLSGLQATANSITVTISGVIE